jgi:hypothetical protein
VLAVGAPIQVLACLITGYSSDAIGAEHGPGRPGDIDRHPDVGHLAEADLLRRDRPGLLLQPQVQRGSCARAVGEHPGQLDWVSRKPPIFWPNCSLVVA